MQYEHVVLLCASIVVLCHDYVQIIMVVGFFFKDTATTEIYTYGHTLSLHDALPISLAAAHLNTVTEQNTPTRELSASLPSSEKMFIDFGFDPTRDRKSTRLNSSH